MCLSFPGEDERVIILSLVESEARSATFVRHLGVREQAQAQSVLQW
jgi:hypothetical protein